MKVSLTLSIFLYFPLLNMIPYSKSSSADKFYIQTKVYKTLHLQSDCGNPNHRKLQLKCGKEFFKKG